MTCKYEGDIATAPAGVVYKPDGRGKLICYEDGGDPDSMADVYWIYEGVFTKGKYTSQGRQGKIAKNVLTSTSFVI